MNFKYLDIKHCVNQATGIACMFIGYHFQILHNVVTDLIAAFAGVEYINRQVDVDEAASAMGGRLPSSSDEDTNDGFFVRQRRHSSGQMQLEEYLAGRSGDLSALSAYPLLCKLFVKLNTALPANAACERLFSRAGFIFTPKRARIRDANFEQQLLLKLNAQFVV